jgi:CRISPR-associated protein Cas1
MEGARVKKMYREIAAEFGIHWKRRRYDRQRPDAADIPNQAINHASTALEAAALVAVAVTGTIPHLGFIHEDSGQAFALDIADLFRELVMLPVAFAAAREKLADPGVDLEREVRKLSGGVFRQHAVVSHMIDRIKELLDPEDSK